MSLNENQVGVQAVFDLSQFTANQKMYDAALLKANAATQAFYQTQITLQIKSAQQAKQSADAIIAALGTQSKAHTESKQTAINALAEIGLAMKGAEQIARIFTGVFQKAFELGEQGARILQLHESFARLTGTGKESTAMLVELSKAVRGTMTDEQLMGPILRMLTGSEAAFADRVRESAPLIYEMAAASAKLNPILGNTSTALDSMAMSLEMGTSRAFKKMGIIIDLTKAEEEYAASIGTTADQLDEEQKKVALLNGVLEYHDTLMSQVGGTVDSAVDPFKRLGVAIDVIADSLRAKFAPGLAAAAEAIALLLTQEKQLKDVHAEHNEQIITTSETYADYIAELQRSYAVSNQLINAQGELEIAYVDSFSGLSQIITEQIALTEAEWNQTRAVEALAKATEKVKPEFANIDVSGLMKAAGKYNKEVEKAAKDAEEKRIKDLATYAEKLVELQIKSGESILSAEKDFQDKSAEAWTTYIEKTSDIIAEGVKKRAELARTLSDAIASAELDYQRGTETASYNHGQKLADIERDYQNTIRNIRQQYSEDSLDAIRNLDAIGLIRAREKRDKDLAAARTGRDQANAAENTNYQRQLYELQRALDDKKREAERAYRRGFDDQKRAESEALRDARSEYNKQKLAAKKAFDDKLAAIQQAYRNEDAAALAHYKGQEAALIAHLRAMQAIMARYNIGGAMPTAGGGGPRGRAKGGLDVVSQPTQFVAGEAGPEMVYTVPLNRAVPALTPQFVNHTGDFRHSIDSAIQSSVAGLDGRITAAVRKALAEVLR